MNRVERGLVCVVTGANAGIGLASATQLVARGATVVMLCRNQERAEVACKAVAQATGGDARWAIADLGSQRSVREAAALLLRQHSRIDVLINNAAAFDLSQRGPDLGDEGLEKIWATNHLGPFLLTRLLIDPLTAGTGRVINVSSKGLVVKPCLRLDLTDPDSRTAFSVPNAYYRSKIAQCAFTVELARRYPKLQPNVVRVANVALADDRLGSVPSAARWFYRNVKRRFALLPERMAETYTWLALDAPVHLRGRHFDEERRIVAFPRQAMDAEFCSELWALSEHQTGLVG